MLGIVDAEDNMTFASTDDEKKLKQQATELIAAYLDQLGQEQPPVAVETTLQEPLVDPFDGEEVTLLSCNSLRRESQLRRDGR